MRQFPVFFNVEGARVLVFGAGEEARRKVRLLAATPAEICVIGETPLPDFEAEFRGRAKFLPPDALAALLPETRFAIIAEADAVRRAALTHTLNEARIPVNVVDHPETCDFTVPSIVDRGDIVAAIGSGGTAPVLAKSIREKIEALLPARLGDLAALAGRLRRDVSASLSDPTARRRFWERAFRGPAAERAFAGDMVGAERLLRDDLKRGGVGSGVVHIVGAGPGDPDLLTLKALRLLQEADVVFFDRLVSDPILALIRRDATRISVGKTQGHHSVPQEGIHELMITAARKGQRVVRLKGGDPFVFGRGGEEAEAVREAGIEVFVVPGISSVLGCAAAAQIPLTHRDHAQTLTLVTGHAKEGGVPDLDWPSLSRAHQTVAVFMGVGTATAIMEKLIAAGRAAGTPVAIIENGTRPNELAVYGRLDQLAQLIDDHDILGPALLIIGEVTALAPGAQAALTQHTRALELA